MATVNVPLERDIQKCITDYLDAELIPYWRMNAGDRFGSTNGNRWRIKGHATGTADLLCSPKIREFGDSKRRRVFLWVEVKRPGKKQTADQIRFEMECWQRDHYYLLAGSMDAVVEWIRGRQ